MKKPFSKSLFVCATILLIFSSFTLKIEATSTVDEYSDAMRQIRSQRTMAESRVKKIKSKFKADSAQYKEAETLYGDAYAEFDGFVAAVASMIRSGEKKVDFENLGKSALEANKKFIDDADKKLNDAPSNWTGIPDPVDAGIKIYNFFKSKSKEKREQKATDFEKTNNLA